MAWGALAILFLFARVFARIHNPRKLKTASDHDRGDFASLIRDPVETGCLKFRAQYAKNQWGTEDGDICRHYLIHRATFENFAIPSSAIT